MHEQYSNTEHTISHLTEDQTNILICSTQHGQTDILQVQLGPCKNILFLVQECHKLSKCAAWAM